MIFASPSLGRRLAAAPFFILALLAFSPFARAAKQSSAPSDETRYEEFNYTFAAPGWPWAEVDPAAANEVAQTAYRKTISDSMFIIIPERTGIEYALTSLDLAEAAKINLQSSIQGATFTPFVSKTVHGLEWTSFSVKAALGNTRLTYSYLTLGHNGWNYQLICWRAGDAVDLNESDLLDLAGKFSLIAPERILHSDLFVPVERVEEPSLGFSIDLLDKGWSLWPNSEVEVPQAMFAVSWANQAFAYAAILLHEGMNPSYRDLKAAFLEQGFGLDPKSVATRDKMISDGEENYLESTFSFQDMTGTQQHAFLRIRKSKEHSYFLCGFTPNLELLPRAQEAAQAARTTGSLAAAPARAALAEGQRAFQANALNSLALQAYSQNNYLNARRYLERALEFGPDDPAIALNFAMICLEAQEYAGIFRLLESREADFAENHAFMEAAATAFHRAGRTEESEARFRALFESGELSESGLYVYLELLAAAERWTDGIAIGESFIDLTGSQNARQWIATFRAKSGDLEGALASLAELKEEKPFDLSIDYDIAVLYYDAQKYSKCLEAIDALGEDADSYPVIHTVRGNALVALHSYEKAKESYARALELNPQDADAKTMLEFTTLALGKGDTNVNVTAIPPVPLPPALASLAADVSGYEGRSFIHHAFLALDYRANKSFKTTRYRKVAIRDDAALDSYSTLSFDFDPFAEEIYINEIVVRDANGAVVAREVREGFYTLHNEQSGIVSQDRILYAPVSGLSKGCTLEYSVTFNRIGLVEELPFTREAFLFREPAAAFGISIAGDVSTLRHASSPDMEQISAADALVWHGSDAVAYAPEPMQADWEAFAPHVAFADSGKDWDALVLEYLEEIEDRLAAFDEVDQVARGLAPSDARDEAVVDAVLSYVQREYTYKALEFGSRARVPSPAPQIIANKYGDCKDLAYLANRLLAARGIDSHLAIVDTRNRLVRSLPSLDQFDHMILYVPDFDGGRFVDCASRHATIALSTPIGLTQRDILVLDPAAPRIVRTGNLAPEESKITIERVIDVSGASLEAEETVEFIGLPAAHLRQYLASVQEPQLLDFFQRLMSSEGGLQIQLEEAKPENVERVEEPLRISFKYRVPRATRATPSSISIAKLPSVWESYFLGVAFIKDRKTPFHIRYPVEFESTVTIRAGANARALAGEWDDVNGDTPFHRFRQTREIQSPSDQVVLRSRIALLPQEQPAGRFAEFQDSAHDALSALSGAVQFALSE